MYTYLCKYLQLFSPILKSSLTSEQGLVDLVSFGQANLLRLKPENSVICGENLCMLIAQ